MHKPIKYISRLAILIIVTWILVLTFAGAPNVRDTPLEPLPTSTTSSLAPLASISPPGVSADRFDGTVLEDTEDRRIAEQMSIDEARMIYGKCGEWKMLALSIGWPEEQWPTLSKVLFRESRCNPLSHNMSDPVSGSRGLMQINGYWCKPSKYSQNGWLQDHGILSECADLFVPDINLSAGLAIWLYGEQKHGCGWSGPWATSCP